MPVSDELITLKPDDLQKTCNFCENHDPYFETYSEDGYSLEELQTGAENGCPRLQLLLACRNWAVPKLFPEEKARFASIREDGRVRISPEKSHFPSGVLHLDCSIVGMYDAILSQFDQSLTRSRQIR